MAAESRALLISVLERDSERESNQSQMSLRTLDAQVLMLMPLNQDLTNM